jgi:methylenetetrahydrofolate reductase (NADPH)
MKVKQFLNGKKPLVSFEFFPPKTNEGVATLMETIQALKELKPSFVSMTYGAGGSTRERTVSLVSAIKHKIGLEAVAHLTCVGHSQSELRGLLKELEGEGIENIVALRGDPPKGQTRFVQAPDGFRYGSELVQFIRKEFNFCVGVAGYPEKHPEAPTLEKDLEHLKTKVDAGGDFVVTQLFFDNRDYFNFVKRLRSIGVTTPVIAGIMPITDVDQIKRFTSMSGATIPPTLLAELEKVKSDKARVIEAGIRYATAQCTELLKKGAPGIHFFTLNKSQSTREIFLNLKKNGSVQ